MNPKVSIVIPIHPMRNGAYFLWRNIQSIMEQTFKDYEIIIVQEGSMPINTNAGVMKARGDLVKILFLDDYFAHEDSLKNIVEAFGENDTWLVTGCLHQEIGEEPTRPHFAKYTDSLLHGDNQIGSPSVLTFKRNTFPLFDTRLSYALDCDLYYRYHQSYGEPKTLNDLNVIIGIHEGQTSNVMPPEEKLKEFKYIQQKHG